MSKKLKQGDLVKYADPMVGVLCCGSGTYPHAVVVSLKPFRLISEYGDMMWTATVDINDFVKVGEASREALIACIDRFNREYRA
jgi:hypothetical protein